MIRRGFGDRGILLSLKSRRWFGDDECLVPCMLNLEDSLSRSDRDCLRTVAGFRSAL